MRTGLSLVGPPPPLPVMPVPMQPQQQPMLGIPSSLPPPPPPVPGYLRKRKPTDGNDLSLGGMNQASGARTRQKITITVLLLHTHRNTLFSLSIIIHYILFSFLFFFSLAWRTWSTKEAYKHQSCSTQPCLCHKHLTRFSKQSNQTNKKHEYLLHFSQIDFLSS